MTSHEVQRVSPGWFLSRNTGLVTQISHMGSTQDQRGQAAALPLCHLSLCRNLKETKTHTWIPEHLAKTPQQPPTQTPQQPDSVTSSAPFFLFILCPAHLQLQSPASSICSTQIQVRWCQLYLTVLFLAGDFIRHSWTILEPSLVGSGKERMLPAAAQLA